MKSITCEVITPLCSTGNHKKVAELRPTELKGLLRYVYRITQQNLSSEPLFKQESEIFGSTDFPSPLRLQMRAINLRKENHFVNKRRNIKLQSFKVGSTFNVTLTLKDKTENNLQWYINMIELSFYLFGMGRRARRARGCVMISGSNKSLAETKEKILHLLNEILSCKQNKQQIYKLNQNVIKPIKRSNEKRPLIQKIVFGEPFHEKELNAYLQKVDDASHQIKKDKNTEIDATGHTNLASAIIVSLTKTKSGYMPIYTYVKAVYNKTEYDKDCSLRSKFQNKIERRERKQ